MKSLKIGEIISDLILDLSMAEKYSLLAKFNKNSDEGNSSDKNFVTSFDQYSYRFEDPLILIFVPISSR